VSKLMGRSAESSGFYAKFAMIKIARYRFRVFVPKFHREPRPHEPIFFDEFQDHPVKADLDTARRQLAEAARASGVRLEPVLKFLGLAPMPVGQGRGTVRVPLPIKSGHLQTQASRTSRDGSRVSSPWRRFLADRRLHRRHAISGEELKMLSQMSFLGQARTKDDYLLILDLIRKAGDQLNHGGSVGRDRRER
jgi:hypothetical protein